MLRSCVRSILAGLLVLSSCVCAYATQVPSAPGMVRIPGHVLPALSKATIVPSKPEADAQPITVTLVLKRDHQAGFERYLHELYDPHSKVFRHFLTQRQIADRFGPRDRSTIRVAAISASERVRAGGGIQKPADADDAWHSGGCGAHVRRSHQRLQPRQTQLLRYGPRSRPSRRDWRGAYSRSLDCPISPHRSESLRAQIRPAL